MLEHLKNTDSGTPISLSEELVTLQIDGREVTVPKGTSLMRAAVDGGIKVPKLCATDSLEPFGSCRLCLVQIEGRKGFPASCTCPPLCWRSTTSPISAHSSLMWVPV